MLQIADLFLTFLHWAIVTFNVLGWIWQRTRKAHLIVLTVTTFSWLAIGLWVGNVGYCFLTDWHWDIKRQLGENNLPNSFVKYYADLLLGIDTNRTFIDVITASGLIFGIVMAIVKNKLWLKFTKRHI